MQINKDTKKGLIVGCIFTTCFFLVVLGIIISIYTTKPSTSSSSKRENIINEIDKYVKSYFLDQYDIEKMNEASIKGYVAALGDKYAEYFTPEEFKMFKQSSDGKYYGVGITLYYDKDKSLYKIESVDPRYGAAKVGMKQGSYIKKINGVDITLDNINKLLLSIKTSKPGTKIKMDILDVDKIVHYEPEVMEITRKIVTSKLINHNLYIKIEEFDNKTYEQFMNEIKKYSQNDFNAIILDLRNNPGGELGAVINVTSEFINQKLITYTVDKSGNREDYNTKGSHSLKGYPLAVLVNENTASASELLTAAIKDYKRGIIIGNKTFGKGIVQQIFPLSNGGAFKETVMKYYTPNGYNIQGKGIEPDIKVESDKNDVSLENQKAVIKATEELNKK